MGDLLKLINRCKSGVYVEVNSHKCAYESVPDFLFGMFSLPSKKWQDKEGIDLTENLLHEMKIDRETLDLMIKNDSVVDIHFYPDTPIGSYRIFHYDIEKALKEALKYK